MPRYLVTGATGFVGRHLLPLLLARHSDADPVTVHVLVRAASQGRLERMSRELPGGDRIRPLIGDLTAPKLGLRAADLSRLRGKIEHVVHLAAIYDMTADAAATELANVAGTRAVLEVARSVRAGVVHHASSVAVAGDYSGTFTEDMFAEGQPLRSPYHRSKYEAERIVRMEARTPWRVYRPSVVVGDSTTGVTDKIDGPYYMFGAIARLRALPRWLPLSAPDLGDTNIVPVDYVAAAMDHLMHLPNCNGRTFHLINPAPQPVLEVVNAFCAAAGAPRVTFPLDRRLTGPMRSLAGIAASMPGVAQSRDVVATWLGVPPQVLPHLNFTCAFSDAATREALGRAVPPPPPLSSYAPLLWHYWEQQLDPDRARRSRGAGVLSGRTVVITGASSGIGEATAKMVAERGGIPLLVARSADRLEAVRREIEATGGMAYAYSCDITDEASVAALVKALLNDHDGGIDMLVNNAGRSIRRSIKLSYDRFHDFERTMALNYFGAVRLIIGLLPHFSERRFGHIVNVSSIGAQTGPPRFSAYVASKSALDAFSKVVASETYGEHVTFTTIHMPLVRTPMIAPTKIYDRFPTISPDQAAAMIVRALEQRPKHIGTALGTVGEVAYAVAPSLVDAVLHQAYRLFPDSTAVVAAAGGTGVEHPATGREAALSQSALLMARLLPGVHW